ncbi:MAG TPA: hypothetical protein VFC46_06855, partial [Humisphaera sp.]|nr:hypothetical protein [Humisphaera sp.]
MARRKHAAALFEVMSGDKKGRISRSNALPRNSSWWFKSRAEPDVIAAVDPNDPTTGTIKSSLIAPRIAAVEEPEPPRDTGRQATPVVRPKRDLIDPTRPANARPGAEDSRSVHFDRARREVKLRLPLTHAIVASFAVMVIVGMAYVMGKRELANTPELSTTETTPAALPDVQPISTAKPKVLDVSRPKPRPPVSGGAGMIGTSRLPAGGPHVRDHDFTSTPSIANSAQGMHVAPRTTALIGPRTVGLNYVVAQCYPSEQIAKDARDFLIKNGLPFTVEKGCSWAPKWFSVVSTRGFEHIHTGECESFQK